MISTTEVCLLFKKCDLPSHLKSVHGRITAYQGASGHDPGRREIVIFRVRCQSLCGVHMASRPNPMRRDGRRVTRMPHCMAEQARRTADETAAPTRARFPVSVGTAGHITFSLDQRKLASVCGHREIRQTLFLRWTSLIIQLWRTEWYKLPTENRVKIPV